MEHFKGIVPEERWKNEILHELRAIRQLLERDAQTVKPETVVKLPEKRQYRKRGVQ